MPAPQQHNNRSPSANQYAPVPTPNILAILKRGQASELKRILVKMQDNKDLIISFRAEKGRYYVTSEKKSHEYGDIGNDGYWRPSRRATDAIAAIVSKVETDPIAYARAHGAKTGRCCFCSRKLTDPTSVRAGYGPVCAKNFGLPWHD